MLKLFIHLSLVLIFFLSSILPAMTKTLSEKQAKSIIGEGTPAHTITLSEFNGISLIGITPSKNENAGNVTLLTRTKILSICNICNFVAN